MNEPVLLDACRRKDGDALAFLIREYHQDVEAGAAKALQYFPNDHAHDPQDLGHDVFVRIIEDPAKRLRAKAQEIRDVHGWLQKLSLRLSLNELKSPRGSKGQVDAPLDFDAVPDPSLDLAELEGVFDGLSDPSRRIVEYSTGCGPDGKPHTLKEIADLLVMPMSTLYYKVSLIIARIRGKDLP